MPPAGIHVGLISDTHGLMRPEALAALQGSDLIIHAGDVGSPDILDALRRLAGDRHFVNVGVLGRPENDGRTNVWYAVLEARPDLLVEFVPIEYDHARLAREMREEGLPEEFIETVRTGWWTTCLEILPAKERRPGKY